MTENSDSQEILISLRQIASYLHLIVFSQKDEIFQNAFSIFGKSKKRAEVYLSLDGVTSAAKIGQQLGMKRPNVSTEIKILLTAGLIEPYKPIRGGFSYRRIPSFELIGFVEYLKAKMQHAQSEEDETEDDRGINETGTNG